MTGKARACGGWVIVASAISFLVFTFVYLYFFQTDALTVSQHILSGRKTHYDRTVGAVIITAVLFLLQTVVALLMKWRQELHAFSYFPSLLLLLFVTSVSCQIDKGFSWGAWIWAAPLAIVLYAAFYAFAQKVLPFGHLSADGLFSPAVCLNVFLLVLMFFLTVRLANDNRDFHHRARAERLLNTGRIDEGLEECRQVERPDTNMTMLYAYGLTRKRQLGDRLFSCPVVHSSAALMPDSPRVTTLLLPEKKILRYRKDKDVWLCSLLMDKDLDKFAGEIGRIYDLKGQLPRHYAEALTLYTRTKASPKVVWKSPAVETDYEDFVLLRRKAAVSKADKRRLKDRFKNTYWFYYYSSV